MILLKDFGQDNFLKLLTNLLQRFTNIIGINDIYACYYNFNELNH